MNKELILLKGLLYFAEEAVGEQELHNKHLSESEGRSPLRDLLGSKG